MHLRNLTAILLTLSLLATGTALAQNETPGAGTTVEPAVADWQSALPVEAIVSELLRELGYDVAEARSLTPPIFYTAVTRGDVDFWANSWMPQQANLLPDDFDDGASLVGTVIEKGAIQGYLASKDAVEEFGITSLADFERPEVLEAFDPDGNGTIEVVGCIPGWTCSQIIEHHMEVYGLTDVIEVIEAAYTPAFADVLARHRAGEPVLYYTWTPNFTIHALPPGEEVMWINVPEIVPFETQVGAEESMTASGVMGAVTDPIRLGFSANDIQVAANDDFLAENPAAHALFERVTLPLLDVSEMTVRVAEGENNAEEVRAMARDWIAENRDVVDEWLAAARAAAE